jgi:hypothetical protein
MKNPLRWLLAVVLCLPASGCGGPVLVKAEGTLLQNGKPLSLSRTGTAQVIFVPDVPPGTPYTTYPADFTRDTGAFVVNSMPRGKYRVTIALLDPNPQVDKLQGKFSQEKTPFLLEVTGEAPIELDLARPPSQ